MRRSVAKESQEGADEREKILIADDTELFLRIEESFLNRENVKVYTATSGLQALKRAVEYEPDLILLDFNMPDLNGKEVCAKLKSRENFKDVPILIVTAEGKDHIFKPCIEAGCDGFIIKPFEMVPFLNKVREYLAIADRKYPRLPVNIPCTLTVADENVAGVIRNLSEGGAFVQAPSSLTEGTSVALKFALPGNTELITCWGVTRWDLASGDVAGFGVEFVNFPEKDRAAIAKLVAVSLGGDR